VMYRLIRMSTTDCDFCTEVMQTKRRNACQFGFLQDAKIK
jgi:hypothetical protein